MTDNRLALIVGANRGIGLGVATEFLAQGWDVIATARRPEHALALGTLSDRYPGRVTVLPLEMNDPAALDSFSGLLGDRVLDAVLVNAGIAGPEHRSASAATEAEIGALMYTNAVAPIRLARSLIEHVRQGSGVMAFTTSVMGSVAVNPGGHELYRASKAALNSFSRGLWGEMQGRKLTLVSVHPGWVRTDMAGQAAPLSVEESASGIVSLLISQAGAHQHRFLDYEGKEIAW